MKKTVLIWVLLFLAFGVCYSQSSLIEYYSPLQYNADRTNWDATKDSLNLIYVGNNYGLLVFDGSNWKSHTVPGRTVRALETAENGTIFCGSANDFGYLDRNENGTLSVISLKEEIAAQLKPPVTIFQILTADERVYFETQNGIITYNYQSSDLTYAEFNVDGSIIIDTELIDNTMFVISDYGLYRFRENAFHPVSVENGILPVNFFSILPFSDTRYLIVDETEGLYTVTKSYTDKQPLTQADNELLVSSHLYLTSKAVPLADSPFYEYLIVTSNGIFHINHKGKILEHYSTENGLISNSVLEVFVDDQSFWVSTDAGVNRVSRSDLLRIFPINDSSFSTLYSAHYRQPYYYLGTNSGIFIKHDSAKYFTPVSEYSDQIWEMIDFKDGVIAAGGNRGLIYLEENRIVKTIPTETAALTVHSLSFGSSHIVAGLFNGAGLLDAESSDWKFNMIPVIDGTIQSVSEDGNSNVWIGTRYDGIYRINHEAFSKGAFDTAHFTFFNRENGVLPEEHHNLFVFHDTLITTTSTGFLYFDEQSEAFKDFRKSIGRYSYPDLVRLSDSSFFLGDDLRRMLVISHSDGTISADENYFNFIPGRIRDIDPLDDARYLVTTSTHLYEISSSGKTQKSSADLWITFSAADRKNNIRSVEFSHHTIPALTFLPGKQISATFSLPNQDIQSAVEYRYRLSSVDTVWSPWSKQTTLTWQSLSSGEHSLEIEAMKPDGTRKQFAGIPFSIHYKWYTGPVAYLFYFFTIGLLIWGFIYVRQYRLMKHTIYLQNLVNERTQEITDQNRSLEEQKRQLVDANKVKSHYLNMAVHDLKNPLGAIKGFTELIEEASENPGHIQAYAEQILKVTQRMLHHIEQLLDTERKEIKKQKQQFTKVNLASVIENAAIQNQLQAERKKQSIETQLDTKLHISGNSLQLFQMADNLLSNAIKFSPSHSAIRLKITFDASSEEICFTISDEGPGIEHKYHTSIFEPWMKTNNKPTGDETSSGLGLNIVKDIVEMHNGSITLVPQEQGTTFEVRFPKA